MVKTWQANVFYGIINTSHMIESIKRWHGSCCLFCFFYYLRLATNRNESIISSLLEADWSTNTSYIEIIQLNWYSFINLSHFLFLFMLAVPSFSLPLSIPHFLGPHLSFSASISHFLPPFSLFSVLKSPSLPFSVFPSLFFQLHLLLSQ